MPYRYRRAYRTPSLQVRDGAVVVYTDGSCLNNGKYHASAGIGVFWSDNHPDNVSEPLLNGRHTSQRAELQAAVEALRIAEDNQYDSLIIMTDSQYVCKGATEWIHKWLRNGWVTYYGYDVANQDDWEELNDLQWDINVDWQHIRRDSCYGNIQADKLAKEGADMA